MLILLALALVIAGLGYAYWEHSKLDMEKSATPLTLTTDTLSPDVANAYPENKSAVAGVQLTTDTLSPDVAAAYPATTTTTNVATGAVTTTPPAA